MKAQRSLPDICQSPFENGRVKSLNKVSRKHDLIRIINDNVKLTERIVFKYFMGLMEKYLTNSPGNRLWQRIDSIENIKIKERLVIELENSNCKMIKPLLLGMISLISPSRKLTLTKGIVE